MKRKTLTTLSTSSRKIKKKTQKNISSLEISRIIPVASLKITWAQQELSSFKIDLEKKKSNQRDCVSGWDAITVAVITVIALLFIISNKTINELKIARDHNYAKKDCACLFIDCTEYKMKLNCLNIYNDHKMIFYFIDSPQLLLLLQHQIKRVYAHLLHLLIT